MLKRLVVIGMLGLALPGCGEKERATPPDDALVFQARDALAAGDKPKALDLYTQAIEIRGTSWAYFERGRLKGEMSDPKGAMEDCVKGLEIDPENRDLIWLRDELKKPKASQFQPGAVPPSRKK